MNNRSGHDVKQSILQKEKGNFMKNRIISSLLVVSTFLLGFTVQGMREGISQELNKINREAKGIQESVQNVADQINKLMSEKQPQIEQNYREQSYNYQEPHFKQDKKRDRSPSPKHKGHQYRSGNNVVHVYVQESMKSDVVLNYLNKLNNGLTFELVDDPSKQASKGVYVFFISTRWDAYFNSEDYNKFMKNHNKSVVIMLQYGFSEQAEIPSEFKNKTATLWLIDDEITKKSENFDKILNQLK